MRRLNPIARARCSARCTAAAVLTAFLAGAVPAWADDPESDVRLDAMRSRARSLQLAFEGRPDQITVEPAPVFRYSAPERTTTDGTLWVWMHDRRPVALLCLFLDPREGFSWNYELVSLTEEPFRVSGRPGWSWRPARRRQLWQPISGPAPAADSRARLLQMRSIIRGLSATEDLDGETVQLRLLPSPVLRYEPSESTADGAMFVFAYGTNPEIAVQIESTGDAERPWRIAFARLAAAELKVMHSGNAIWKAERVQEWLATRPYFSHYGPDPQAGPASDEQERVE